MVIYFKAISRLAVLLVLFTIVGGTPQCPKLTECPFRAENCTDDTDCAVDSLCCDSPCGNVCAKQLNTGCETLRRAASRRAKALGVETKSVRSPRCTKSGAFEPIQCDNEIVSSCWCVDDAGFELAGTKAPAVALVNCTALGCSLSVVTTALLVLVVLCAFFTYREISGRWRGDIQQRMTAQKACAFHTCRMFCEHGFALAEDGCPLCRCHDPCENIKCPNSLACHLEKLACSDPPCPPVPTCKRGRSLDNMCPVGDALRISDTVNPFLCGNDPGKPTCPPLYQCLVDPGNDYGVCCPASLKIRKPGTCPVQAEDVSCGSLCTHDLECQSVQKCCDSSKCGSHCVHPSNVTECYHQRALSELLAVSERAGKGYIPQCTSDGQFEPKQCSRNGLVCWCVDRGGHKVSGSMGAAANVTCSIIEARDRSSGRSLNGRDGTQCDKLECAAVCEYGFKLDTNGCPTCKCDDPCEGYTCPENEECIAVKEANCTDFLCPTLPVCRPKATYVNPCTLGTPLTDDITGTPITCSLRASAQESSSVCPATHECTAVAGSLQSVCCLLNNTAAAAAVPVAQQATGESDEVKEQTMCQYLHDFSESMEGTREGMQLALPSPSCDADGHFRATQCHRDECWCVDQFGTEIPKSRSEANATANCDTLRESLECLDLTCRMSCDYGFEMSEETRCPTCQCRDPCATINCAAEEQCQLVEVSCKDHYCPPVPACLPKKMGQCPYLVPPTSTSCDFECNTDVMCNGTTRCCSNGCGTQCVEPLLLSACQHQRSVAQHQAHESGTPAGQLYIPACKADGSFEPSQCNSGTRECWCVDFRGFEISKTRTSLKKPLKCDSLPRQHSQQQCPLYKCAEDCEHGFELDDKGCRTCTCIDPCTKVTCRGEGEFCRLVNVECVDSPCPAVPMCLPKKENPCQTGQPLKVGYSDDAVACGPDYESCPSSHKCQLSPLGEYAVCCPKPREVCFEGTDSGVCLEPQLTRNLSRWNFNPRVNKCERFSFGGCQGNHNNFQTEEQCKAVCPVLSQCERLREKNQKSAERYKKPTFAPRCEASSGLWQPVQCLEHVGVCWCVNPQGEPVKGTLIRGKEPECNFRQARNRARNRADVVNDAELVLEELMMQLGSLDSDDSAAAASNDMDVTGNDFLDWKVPLQTRCESLQAQCDSQGQFLPSQCEAELCWCVDEAGNQLAQTSSFKRGDHLCLPTPVESVDVTLGFRGEYDDVSATPVTNQINKLIRNLQGAVSDEGFYVKPTEDALYVSFSLIGANKVDVAFRLEQMVTQQRLPGLVADITRSRFIHKLGTPEPLIAERIVSLEHREIVSQSPVSMIAPYHTALIVIAAGSAFVISVLMLLVILYRRKIANMHNTANKIVDGNQRFLSYNRPIYIELPKEKKVEQFSVEKS